GSTSLLKETKSAWGETVEETCAASDVTLIKTITERNRVIRDSWVGFGFSERERFRLGLYQLVSTCRFVGQPAIASMRSHSSSVTGITDRRDIRTSGNDANALSAFTAASVTGDFSLFSGTMSMAYSFPVLSAGSGYGAPAAFATPPTAFTSPV